MIHGGGKFHVFLLHYLYQFPFQILFILFSYLIFKRACCLLAYNPLPPSVIKLTQYAIEVNLFTCTLMWLFRVMSHSLQPHGLQHARLLCPPHLLEFAWIHVHWVSDTITDSSSVTPVSSSLVAQMVRNPLAMQETKVDPCVGKIPWRREWQPTPVCLPGKSRGQRSLPG